MSARGPETAVVSIGVSCQTAWQIKKQVGLLSELVGETLEPMSSPFDWLIMPPLSYVSWMRAGGGLPNCADEIVVHPNFYWPRHNLHFWHEFTKGGSAAVAETFHDVLAKFTHLLERFYALQSCRRRIFFVSNTQSNLDEVHDVSPRMNFRFDREIMAAVAAAVRQVFGAGSEIHFVTRQVEAGVDPDAAFRVHRLPHDMPEVLGDDGVWTEVFRAALIPGGRVGSRPA